MRIHADVRWLLPLCHGAHEHHESACNWLEAELRQITKGFPYSPKLWQDAYLAAIAIASDFPLITFDQGFSKFARLKSLILKKT